MAQAAAVLEETSTAVEAAAREREEISTAATGMRVAVVATNRTAKATATGGINTVAAGTMKEVAANILKAEMVAKADTTNMVEAGTMKETAANIHKAARAVAINTVAVGTTS